MKVSRLVGLALLVGTMSCGDGTAPLYEIVDLETAHQRWRAQNLRTYAFKIQWSCFCANVHPLRVLVVNNEVAAVLDLETGEMIDRRLGTTVDGLFAFIRDAVARPARLIRVKYDPKKGFPTEIEYDGEASIADDEGFVRVSDVHAVAR